MNINNFSLTAMKNIQIGQQLDIKSKAKDIKEAPPKTDTLGLDTFVSSNSVNSAAAITRSDDIGNDNNDNDNTCYAVHPSDGSTYGQGNARKGKAKAEILLRDGLQVNDQLIFDNGTFHVTSTDPVDGYFVKHNNTPPKSGN